MAVLSVGARLAGALVLGAALTVSLSARRPDFLPHAAALAALWLALAGAALGAIELLRRGARRGVLCGPTETLAFVLVATAVFAWVAAPLPARLKLLPALKPWMVRVADAGALAALLAVSFALITWVLALVFRDGPAAAARPDAGINRPVPEHPARRRANRRAVLIVLAVALVIRLWALGTFHLLIWDDSPMYLGIAKQQYDLGTLSLHALSQIPGYPPHQMPGYSIALAYVFHVFGVSGLGVLVVQHLAGVLGAVLLTAVAARFSAAWLAAGAGILFSLDPTFWVLESWAMSEAFALGAFIAAAAFALLVRRPGPAGALLLGVLCAMCYLIRPNLQIAVPFVAGAWLLQVTRRWSLRIPLGLVILLGFLPVVAPWREFNAQRGVKGFWITFGAHQWWSAACSGLLDTDIRLGNPELEAAIAPYRGKTFTHHDAWAVWVSTQAYMRPALWPELGRWAWECLARRPGAYVRAVGRACLWHLNVYPPAGPPLNNELREKFFRRAALDDYNPEIPGAAFDDFRQRLHMHASGGPLRRFIAWYAEAVPQGVPQIPLAALALLALVRSARRREWSLALVLCGAFAIAGLNAVTLAFPNRYSMPAWAVWYLGVALAFGPARLRPPRAASRALPNTAMAITSGQDGTP